MSETVGVVGAGRMGLPIIGHLARKGFRTLATDVNAAKKNEVEQRGAQWIADIAGIGNQCTVILVCVGFDHEVVDLFPRLGAGAGSIVAVLSTIHPATVQRLAKEAQGVHVIDSTVCRGGQAADRGTLLSFVGGAAEIVERVTPVLRAYSSDVVHSGDVGSAQVAKAANNLILWACLVADHEALALAKRFGLDPERLRNALLLSSAAIVPDESQKWEKIWSELFLKGQAIKKDAD